MSAQDPVASTAAVVAGPAVASPWDGIMGLLAGGVLLGISLPHAVTDVAPLLATIAPDLGLDTLGSS